VNVYHTSFNVAKGLNAAGFAKVEDGDAQVLLPEVLVQVIEPVNTVALAHSSLPGIGKQRGEHEIFILNAPVVDNAAPNW
jgi:hypothetical protein